MKTSLTCIVLASSALAASQASAATVWSLGDDFPSSYVNPNGVWRYGYWDAGYANFTLYNSFANAPAGEPRIDNFHHNGDLDSWGNVGYGDGGETFTRNDWPHGMHFEAYTITLMTAIADMPNRTTSAGFIAPEAGDYLVTVTFKNNNADGEISRAVVLTNIGGVSTVVDQADVSGFGDEGTAPGSFHTFTETFSLATGDGIYFAQPYHPDAADARWHHLGTTATITLVPEPASLAFLGLGAASLLRRRRS